MTDSGVLSPDSTDQILLIECFDCALPEIEIKQNETNVIINFIIVKGSIRLKIIYLIVSNLPHYLCKTNLIIKFRGTHRIKYFEGIKLIYHESFYVSKNKFSIVIFYSSFFLKTTQSFF
jgi:hypothetical protein